MPLLGSGAARIIDVLKAQMSQAASQLHEACLSEHADRRGVSPHDNLSGGLGCMRAGYELCRPTEPECPHGREIHDEVGTIMRSAQSAIAAMSPREVDPGATHGA